MSVKGVGNVGSVAELQKAGPRGLDLGARLEGLFGSTKLPAIQPPKVSSPSGFGDALSKLTGRLLGVDGPHGQQKADGTAALARLNAPFPNDVLAAATKNWKQGIPVRSPEERAKLNAEFAKAITDVQTTFAKKEDRDVERGQHAKSPFAVPNARFEVRPDLPKELQFGAFTAGADHRTLIRFSNAPSSVGSDGESARRGIALRFTDDKGHSQDLLLTTGSPAFLAKDGVAAVTAAKAEASGAAGLAEMAKKLGPKDAAKLIYAARTTDSKDESLAAATYFSRVPYQMGDYAVKFRLVPVAKDATLKGPKGDNQLTTDMQNRLKVGDVEYVLEAQFNRNPADMADARIDWDSPYVAIGKITIPQQDVSTETAKKGIATMDDLSFKPWNRWSDDDDRVMRPLGDVNEARKAVYEASSANRGSGPANNHRCPMGYG